SLAMQAIVSAFSPSPVANVDLPLPPELEVYRRELPRLLEGGEERRFALILGTELDSIWDTYRDATQAGYMKNDPAVPFAGIQIDAGDLERIPDQASQASESAMSGEPSLS